jgi:hypothetical protein
MNRSLEALAIFAVCLGGILAVVRVSTQDATGPKSVANRAKAPAVPATGSSSAADGREEIQPDEVAPVEPVTNLLAHEQGCGLDRVEGKVYPPQSPLLSQREIAERAIRSAPWRIYVLTDADALADEVATGYDEEYDAAMTGRLTRRQVEADYAAAELAAARETELNPKGEAFVKNLLTIRDSSLQQLLRMKTAYAEPAARAVENKWSVSSWPLLVQYPRAKREARQHLRHQQRTEAGRKQVSWDDYLSFAERHLTQSQQSLQTAQEQKAPKSKLFPR